MRGRDWVWTDGPAGKRETEAERLVEVVVEGQTEEWKSLYRCVYLHAGAIALVRISKPVVSCCALVQVDVLDVDVHTDHTSDAERRRGHTRDG
ncbi:hypothetical protein INR49_008831 [Caranx melampygus]|nr:hypothetical protein INR49_008831 [Caranx melampygus]